MKFRTALQTAAQAAKANLLPGLLLQGLMIVFLAAYVCHEGTQRFLQSVADLKDQSGYLFAFCSYVLAAALLPEVLKIGFFQECRIRRKNVSDFLTGAPFWGMTGMLVDLFYRYQAVWFGTDHSLSTIILKLLVDQFIYSPFLSVPLCVGYFRWRDAGFSRSALRETFRLSFITEYLLPAQVAGWCIWIPGVALVYFMPSLLQLPVATLIQIFWVLVFTFVNERRGDKPRRVRASSPELPHDSPSGPDNL